ncbi:hypothetical protein [Streptomyces sp. NBC_00328]|uniref:hypothetical protein n=1 Tax=Streptomyces sp. NBC_00328 TaxID=2903646 RepID=UPI002E27F605|nr:hypothetical protein [Streptomyces sp. NBC_00328]
MTDPDDVDPRYDDPYERGKLDRASCGWIFMGGCLLVVLASIVMMVGFVAAMGTQR